MRADAGEALPLPMELAAPNAVPFVARAEHWATLEAAWGEVVAGGRRTVLIAGEAGAGKSRLATEFARRVHDDGAVVLYGACPEDGVVPYAPFRDMGAWFLRSGVSAGADERLLEGLRPLTGARPSPTRRRGPTVEDQRYLVADAMTELIETLVAAGPVLVLLDDLQWADPATMALVDDLTRGARPSGCAVVITHRTEPAELGTGVRAALADLRRRPGALRLTVRGFDDDGVRAFVEAAAGHPLHLGLEGVVHHLATETGGNAFFLGELWRHLTESGRLVRPGARWRLEGRLDHAPSPPGVRDVVAARLARLPAPTRAVVDTAAVIGSVFDHALVAAAMGAAPGSVLADLEPACEAGLVVEVRPGSGRFSHALVRRAAYDEQPAESRHERHLAVARALETMASPGREVAVAAHLLAAVPLIDRSEAIAAARSAAAAAVRAGRHRDAAATLGAALDLSDPGPHRGRLLLELAEANMRAGDVAGAEAAALEAHHLGVRHDDADLVIDGALVHAEAIWRAALPGDASRAVIETALVRADDELTLLRLRAARARALALSGEDEPAREEAELVLEQARAAGDLETIRAAYVALLFTPWTPASVHRLLEASRDFADLAASVGEQEWELWAIDKVLLGLVIVGELDEARRVASRHHTLAEAVAQPLFRVLDHQVRALLAIGEGRFDAAETEAVAAREVGEFLSGRDASGGFGVQMFSLRREQGRLDEARPMVEAVARLGQEAETWRPALAVLYADLGMRDEAVAVLDALGATGFRSIPRDSLWPAALVYLVEAAVATGHDTACGLLHAELAAYAGHVMVAGTFLAAYGAADRYLGMTAAAGGDLEEATRHFETALRLESACRMPTWVARTQAAYGAALVQADDPVTAARGATILRFAVDTAARTGMRSLERDARAALAGVTTEDRARGPAPADLTDRELAVLRLLAEGRSNRQIGDALHISHHTAANHVRAILMKSGCRNRTEAAAWALRLGLTAG